MDYKETIELEENVKLKNQADKIYSDFLKNVKLSPKNYKGDGKFLHWADSHNATYFVLNGDTFTYVCNFLHEKYQLDVTPSSIFSALKNKYRGVDHLRGDVIKKATK